MHRGTTIFLLSTSIGAALAFACAPQVDPHYSGEPLATLRGAVVSDGDATAADVAVLWFKSDGNQCSGPSVYCGAGGGGGAEGAACAEACGPFPTECNEEVLASFGACVQACGWDFSYDVGWELCVDAGVGERVSVEGDFPAAFTLDLYQPPPESALIAAEDGLRVAFGWFIVAHPEVEVIELDLNQGFGDGIIGGSSTHALVYAADPIPADSSWGRYMGGALDPGYHVLEVVPGKECPDQFPPSQDFCATTQDSYTPSPADLNTEISVEIAAPDQIDWPGL